MSGPEIIIAGSVDLDPTRLDDCLAVITGLQEATRGTSLGVWPTCSGPTRSCRAASPCTSAGPTPMRWPSTSSARNYHGMREALYAHGLSKSETLRFRIDKR